MQAAEQVEQLLADNPRGELRIVTGYASLGGLSWLGERTEGRPVSLVIGDMSKRHFDKATPRICESAALFLARSNVSVLTKKMRNKPEDVGKPVPIVHAKAWMIRPTVRSTPRVLCGSANLTFQGMYRNLEMMCAAQRDDARRLWDEMDELLKASRNATPTLLENIAALLPQTAPSHPQTGRGGPRRSAVAAKARTGKSSAGTNRPAKRPANRRAAAPARPGKADKKPTPTGRRTRRS